MIKQGSEGVYWHRLVDEFINRYVDGAPRYYLPPLGDAAAQDYPKRDQGESHPRISLSGGLYLTHREAECMHWMLRGCTMKNIASKLHLSPRTIEYYLKRLKERWGCKSKKELLFMLQHQGFTCYEKSSVSETSFVE